MLSGSAKLMRHVIEGKLENTLALWLDAIALGNYTEAKRILDTRVRLRAELVELLRHEATEANDAAHGDEEDCRGG